LADQLSGAGVSACQPVLLIQARPTSTDFSQSRFD
jgi:hypothetical protein